MIQVYIDPFSHEDLTRQPIRKEDITEDMDFWLVTWAFVREYCRERNINLQTINFWNAQRATAEDVYATFNYKLLLTRVYWHWRKNKAYPIVVNPRRFKRRIMFQGEPPNMHPEVYVQMGRLARIFDAIFLTGKTDDSRFRHYWTPRPYTRVLPQYWENRQRKFLVMVNGNKRGRLFRRALMHFNAKYFARDLIGERIRMAAFFATYGELDLYGYDWDKRPPFPYWFYKKRIEKAYKGTVPSKLQTLSEYAFCLAPENHIARGFLGEALFDCFYAGTVPVYLGASDVETYIPKNCFIDMRDFANYEELRAFLKSRTEKDIEAYREHARAFLVSDKMHQFTKEHFAEVFVDAVTGKRRGV
ncbi:MAG: hypothetical protein HYW65_00445 [Candidatus Liptonbacteria bacterium]|nr:hypothetical protein [Candidatus Liptonbacteria bacterium]